MKLTNKQKENFIRQKLGSDCNWALKALVRIYTENQTYEEKMVEKTVESNGIGFTGTDGEFMSSLAKQAKERGSLTEKQMVSVFKLMPKYWRQVLQMADKEKLEKQILESVKA